MLLREDRAAGGHPADQRQARAAPGSAAAASTACRAASLSALNVSDFKRMPREVPPTSSITPLRARACRCSSAALAERKPSSAGDLGARRWAPVRSIALARGRGSAAGGAVSLGFPARHLEGGWLTICPVPVFSSRFPAKCKAPALRSSFSAPAARSPAPRRVGRRQRGLHGRADRRRAAGALRCRRCPGVPLEGEQVAQVDSKDMDAATWQALAQRVSHHLARPEVGSIVVTHGTDTLEETAYLLHRVLSPAKPVVLTASMRPATALLADGPQNLLDAVRAGPPSAGARACSLSWPAACSSPRQAAQARQLPSRCLRRRGRGRSLATSGRGGACASSGEWPAASRGRSRRCSDRPVDLWPRVEIVTSHAGIDGRLVQALCAAGGRRAGRRGPPAMGQCTGRWRRPCVEAQARGVAVLRATRCPSGTIVQGEDAGPAQRRGAHARCKARIELMLRLLAAAPDRETGGRADAWPSGQSDVDVDVAAGGVRVRADLVGLVHQGLSGSAVHAGHGHASCRPEMPNAPALPVIGPMATSEVIETSAGRS